MEAECIRKKISLLDISFKIRTIQNYIKQSKTIDRILINDIERAPEWLINNMLFELFNIKCEYICKIINDIEVAHEK